MTHLIRELSRRDKRGDKIRTAVIGAGLMGRGLVHQLSRMPGMFPSLVVNRTLIHAVEAYRLVGFQDKDIVISDDPDVLAEAVARGKPAVSSTPEIAAKVNTIDVVIEATGAVEYGAREALSCIQNHKHIVLLNAETDATVGCLLKKKADEAGVVYSVADGDQPGVIMRMVEYCRGIGFEVMSAVNCKGFMNIRANPESIKEWAIKQNTSPVMTAAFTDGTKINIEQNVVSNATGLIPAKRGMIGIKTDLKNALKDFGNSEAFRAHGTVEYTLGGDFGGGIFIICRSKDAERVKPYMSYFKMGDGPNYLFFRPWHLCHFETPLSAAEAVIYKEPTVAPRGRPISCTVAVAKRDLKVGDMLDGIGGFNQYGQIDSVENCDGLLPIGLAENVRLLRNIKQDEPIPLSAVELDETRLLVKLWKEQQRM